MPLLYSALSPLITDLSVLTQHSLSRSPLTLQPCHWARGCSLAFIELGLPSSFPAVSKSFGAGVRDQGAAVAHGIRLGSLAMSSTSSVLLACEGSSKGPFSTKCQNVCLVSLSGWDPWSTGDNKRMGTGLRRAFVWCSSL